MTGSYKEFYENGQIQHEFCFDKNGKRIGIQRYYHSNGVIGLVANYKEGLADGFVVEFDSLGKLIGKPWLNGFNRDANQLTENDENKLLLNVVIDMVAKENECKLKSKN